MCDQPFQPGAAWSAVHGLGLVLDVLGKDSAAAVPAQFLESPQPHSRIGRYVCHANLLPGAGELHTLGHVISQPSSPADRNSRRQGCRARGVPVRVARALPCSLARMYARSPAVLFRRALASEGVFLPGYSYEKRGALHRRQWFHGAAQRSGRCASRCGQCRLQILRGLGGCG